VDRLDAAGHLLVSAEPPADIEVTPRKVIRDLELLRRAAMEAGAFAPALRAIELMGRSIEMWKSETANAGPTLEELVNASFAPEVEIKP
jgi:hypothetical protein